MRILVGFGFHRVEAVSRKPSVEFVWEDWPFRKAFGSGLFNEWDAGENQQIGKGGLCELKERFREKWGGLLPVKAGRAKAIPQHDRKGKGQPLSVESRLQKGAFRRFFNQVLGE